MALAALPNCVGAAPLNPNNFSSLGALDASDTIEIQSSPVWYLPGEAVLRYYAADLEVLYFGVINPLTNTAVFTFDSINIPAGLDVFVLGNRPVALLSRGSITVSGNFAAGQSAAGTGAGFDGDENAGGGGGGFGGRGGDGALNGLHPLDFHGDGGPAHGNLSQALILGSPGGEGGQGIFSGGGGPGGAGGGGIELGALGPIILGGQIAANGAAGETGLFSPGGGGGSGGAILVHSSVSISLGPSALLDVSGGVGGEGYVGSGGGGGGGGGRVFLQAPSVVNQGMIDISGGAGGVGMVAGQPGSAGDVTISLVPEPSTLALTALSFIGILAYSCPRRCRRSRD